MLIENILYHRGRTRNVSYIQKSVRHCLSGILGHRYPFVRHSDQILLQRCNVPHSCKPRQQRIVRIAVRLNPPLRHCFVQYLQRPVERSPMAARLDQTIPSNHVQLDGVVAACPVGQTICKSECGREGEGVLPIDLPLVFGPLAVVLILEGRRRRRRRVFNHASKRIRIAQVLALDGARNFMKGRRRMHDHAGLRHFGKQRHSTGLHRDRIVAVIARCAIVLLSLETGNNHPPRTLLSFPFLPLLQLYPPCTRRVWSGNIIPIILNGIPYHLVKVMQCPRRPPGGGVAPQHARRHGRRQGHVPSRHVDEDGIEVVRGIVKCGG
mmetsp:Transcript_3717/g.8420  ORF Transcript_3717/g.8420 Transcript_3717/m.8420 type:complete len:323 (-) Transcript_3717:1327-2295(-)